jgi:DsbC/DsbD-like thiol-disulfide interchange protein
MLYAAVTRLLCRFLLASVWFCFSMAMLAEDSADRHVKLELVSDQDAIVPNRPLRLGIRFDLEDGWHTYWINPGDSGEPPRIEWELPAGFQAGPIQWPYPSQLSTPPLVDYGYEHEVLLAVPVRPPSGLKAGVTEKLVARVHYLVCRDVCIPGQKQLVLELPVKAHAGATAEFPLFESTRRRLPKPMPEGWKVSAVSAGDEFLLTVRTGAFATDPQFFPLEPEQIDNAAPRNASVVPGGVRLHLKKSNHLLKPISHLKGVMVVSGVAYFVDVPVAPGSR